MVGGNWIGDSGSAAGGSVAGSTARAASMAPRAFTRRPLLVCPSRAPETCPPCLIASMTSTAVASGSAARTSAATPDTCGVAMEVPLMLM